MKTHSIDPKELPKISERTHAWTLEERLAFRRLPPEERKKMMEEMADDAAKHYDDDYADWNEIQGGDIAASTQSKINSIRRDFNSKKRL